MNSKSEESSGNLMKNAIVIIVLLEMSCKKIALFDIDGTITEHRDVRCEGENQF